MVCWLVEWQGDTSVGGMAGWCVDWWNGWVVSQLVKWKGGVLAGHWWNGWVLGWWLEWLDSVLASEMGE